MTPPKIETPQGMVYIGDSGKAYLRWNTNFKPKWQKRYTDAQRFVDNEVLSLCNFKYIPLQTGMLMRSGELGTDIGSGTVQWIAPYAKQQYYKGRSPGRSGTGPLRGAFWFERMKEVHGDKIIKGARKLAGGKK